MFTFGVAAFIASAVVIFAFVRRRMYVAEGLAILSVVVLMTFCFHRVNTEYQHAAETTFWGSDLQVTIGIDCINDTVMYREMDSVRRVEYPRQVFNDYPFGGELTGKMSCHNGVFRDAEGKALARDTVLERVTRNVITGYLPWTSSNTGNHFSSAQQ